MKSNRAVVALLALTAIAFGLPAAAQITMGSDRPHFYAGGSVGTNDDEEIAWRALGGYQIDRMFAAELGYHRLGEIPGGAKAQAWELVGLGGIPLGPVSLYGKLGLFRGDADRGSNTDLTYGAGVQYDLARNLGLRGEWQRYNGLKTGGNDVDVEVLSLGAIFRFE